LHGFLRYVSDYINRRLVVEQVRISICFRRMRLRMYEICRVILIVIITSCAVFGSNLTLAASSDFAGGCASGHDCIFQIRNDTQSKALCYSKYFSVVWQNGSSKYLLECRSGGTAEDNTIWIVERKMNLLKRLNFGRFIEKIRF